MLWLITVVDKSSLLHIQYNNLRHVYNIIDTSKSKYNVSWMSSTCIKLVFFVILSHLADCINIELWFSRRPHWACHYTQPYHRLEQSEDCRLGIT